MVEGGLNGATRTRGSRSAEIEALDPKTLAQVGSNGVGNFVQQILHAAHDGAAVNFRKPPNLDAGQGYGPDESATASKAAG